MASRWATCSIPGKYLQTVKHTWVPKAERQCVQVSPKNNHVGWDSDIGRCRRNCSLSPLSVFRVCTLDFGPAQRGTTIHGGETSSWLIRGCRDKQVAIMQTLDSSYAAFNRSPPWRTTTSRNTYAFQEAGTVLHRGKWKARLWLEYTENTQNKPTSWRGRNKGMYLWASGSGSVRSVHW